MSVRLAKKSEEWAAMQHRVHEVIARTLILYVAHRDAQNEAKLRIEESKAAELQHKVEHLQRIIHALENDLAEERASREKLRNKFHTKVESFRVQREMDKDNTHQPSYSDNEGSAGENLRLVKPGPFSSSSPVADTLH